ncbi:hypothetical protein ACVWY0_002485 [Arthrobacter sp. UYNi723]
MEDADAAFARMEAAGYLAKVDLGDDSFVWEATTLGNALAMAGFGRPSKRRTADRLVAGMLERAREYNVDATRPLYVERLRLFGSYLDRRLTRSGMSTSNCPSKHSAPSWPTSPGHNSSSCNISRTARRPSTLRWKTSRTSQTGL